MEVNNYCDNATSILGKYWTDLNGNGVIDDFESKWTQWKIKDTIKWFEYILSLQCKQFNNDRNDYVIEDLSDTDRESDSETTDSDSDANSDSNHDHDEKKDSSSNRRDDSENHNSKEKSGTKEIVDYKLIENRLISVGFRAKKYLPLIQDPVQFRHYGFNNKKDCKLLYKYTKQLLEKYPKQSIRNKKKNKLSTQEIEGCVDATIHAQ